VVLQGAYVIARTANGRPSLQHRVHPTHSQQTACGYDISAWSRHYMREVITEVLCKQPGCRQHA
jgi:hypothetical protein